MNCMRWGKSGEIKWRNVIKLIKKGLQTESEQKWWKEKKIIVKEMQKDGKKKWKKKTERFNERSRRKIKGRLKVFPFCVYKEKLMKKKTVSCKWKQWRKYAEEEKEWLLYIYKPSR